MEDLEFRKFKQEICQKYKRSLLSVKDVSEILCIQARTVYRMMYDEKSPPYIKVRGSVKFIREGLINWLRENYVAYPIKNQDNELEDDLRERYKRFKEEEGDQT